MYAKVIKQLMKENGFDNETQLSKEIDVTQQGLNRILNGKAKTPQINTLNKIGAGFGITGRQIKIMVNKEIEG